MSGEARFGEHVHVAARAVAHRDVIDVRTRAQREVRRQRPGSRRPREQVERALDAEPLGAARHAEAHRERRILHVLVVRVRFEIAERRRQPEAVRHDPVRLVDAPLIPEPLEDPPDGLHEARVHRLVVVVEVDPTTHARHRLAPLGDVRLHHRAALLVERADAVRLDRGAARQPERLLRQRFDRQPVTIPTEAPLHRLPAHVPIARHDVLDRPGEQMPVVRRAGRERRPVVEHERLPACAPPVRLLERFELRPELENSLLFLGKVDLRRELLKRRGSRHRVDLRWASPTRISGLFEQPGVSRPAGRYDPSTHARSTAGCSRIAHTMRVSSPGKNGFGKKYELRRSSALSRLASSV